MPVIIRAARPNDYPAIAALYHESDAVHAAGAPDLFRLPVAPIFPRAPFERDLADPRQASFVAERDGRVAGIVRLALQEARPSAALVEARMAYVVELIVHHAERGAGLGRVLMQRGEEWAWERGCRVRILHPCPDSGSRAAGVAGSGCG